MFKFLTGKCSQRIIQTIEQEVIIYDNLKKGKFFLTILQIFDENLCLL